MSDKLVGFNCRGENMTKFGTVKNIGNAGTDGWLTNRTEDIIFHTKADR